MQALTERKQEVLEKLMAIGTARRGQLSEQYYESKGSDGKVRRQGPYYVWQRWVNGRKHSMRIPKSMVKQVKEDLERGRQVQVLLDTLFSLMEESASGIDAESKKKLKRSKLPAGEKSHNF